MAFPTDRRIAGNHPADEREGVQGKRHKSIEQKGFLMMDDGSHEHVCRQAVAEKAGPDMVMWATHQPEQCSTENADLEDDFRHVELTVERQEQWDEDQEDADGVDDEVE